MRKRFDNKLKKLKNTILELGSECEAILETATGILRGQKEYVETDLEHFEERIYHLKRSLDKQSFEILLRDQPMARDLYFVSTAPQLTRDLERIAEQGLEIMQLVGSGSYASIDEELEITKAMLHLSEMLKVALNTYAMSEQDSFELIREKDNAIDIFFSQGKMRVIRMIEKNSETSSDILDVVILIKYMERIGDHIVSFSKWDGVAKRQKTSIV